MDLAKSNIQHICLNEWNVQSFMEATKEAIGFTGDTSLHDTMASAAAEHITELLDNDDLTELIGDFGIKILRHRVQRVERDAEDLRSRLWQLHTELEEEQARRQAADNKTVRVIENVDRCLDTLRETVYCRNGSCHAEFECYVEKHGQVFQPVYTLRCARCRCRH